MTKPPKPKKPKQPDLPWKILSPIDRGATKGDSDPDKLLASVGFALSKWEEFEEELAKLFGALVGAKHYEPAARAYGTVNNFRSRADMVEAAAEAFFFGVTDMRLKIAGPDRLIAQTKPSLSELLNHSRQFAGRRNEIAHGRYGNVGDSGYFLKPAFYNEKKYGFTPETMFGSYFYTSVEIYIYADHFSRLTQQTKDVRSAIETIVKKTS